MGFLDLARPALTHLSNPLEGWQEIAINECGEPLEPLTGSDALKLWPVYHRRGYQHAADTLWLRAGLHAPLHTAAEALPDGYTLAVLDAWRSPALQQELFVEYRTLLARTTSLQGTQLESLTRRFVSAPSEDEFAPSPHATGACVDVALFYHGEYLDIGAQFDEMSDRSQMAYYERPDMAANEQQYRDRRRILQTAMEHAGWVDYPAECWHFSMGDQMGMQPARLRGEQGITARYGGITPGK
jgi:D-alanyl-D-alanine dipeptidase